MSMYLWTKCKGKYRVLPEFDLITGDIPRDHNGDVDKDYDDWYLSNAGASLKIKHAYHDQLSCYLNSVRKGHNTIHDLYNLLYQQDNQVFHYDMVTKLQQDGYILEYDETSVEAIFTFKIKYLDQFNSIFNLRTRGAGTHPLNRRNYKKVPYQIPQKDLSRIQDINLKIEKIGGNLQVARLIRQAFTPFVKNRTTQYKNMDTKAYIHMSGHWQEFVEYYNQLAEQFIESYEREVT